MSTVRRFKQNDEINEEDLTSDDIIPMEHDPSGENDSDKSFPLRTLKSYINNQLVKNYGTDIITDCDEADHSICWTNSTTLNTPYKEGLTQATRGKLITEDLDSSNSYNCQIFMSGGEFLYTRRKTSSGWEAWQKLIRANDLLSYGLDTIENCNSPTSIFNCFTTTTLNSPYTEGLTTATTGLILSSLINSSSSRCIQFAIANTVNMSKFVFTRYKTDASTWTNWKIVSLTLTSS